MTEQNSQETKQAETLVRFEKAKKNRKEAKENLQRYKAELKKIHRDLKETQTENRQPQDAKINFEKAQKELDDKKEEVIKAAAELNENAAIAPLKQIKRVAFLIYEKLQLSGTVTVGYIFSVILGLLYDYIFYSRNGIDIFYYAQPEDFFVSGHKLLIIPIVLFLICWLIQNAISLLLGKLVSFKIPIYTETIACFFPRLINRLPITTLFVILVLFFSICFTVQGAYYYASKPSSEGKVTVVAEHPLELIDNLIWLGSNSTYAFFKSASSSRDKSNILILPLNRIICIHKHRNVDNSCALCEINSRDENSTDQVNYPETSINQQVYLEEIIITRPGDPCDWPN